MKNEIVKEVDIKRVAEFLVNQEKEKLLKEEKGKEKSDDIQSLELLLGMKVIALWVDNIGDGKSWNNARLNIRCLQEVNVEKGGYLKEVQGRADVEMTMVWEFKELRDLKALDFVPEGKGHCGKNE
jgi:hypothetical protein